MAKYSTQLQIVKRNIHFVVQIRKQNFFTRRWHWIDLETYFIDLQRAGSNCQLIDRTKFNNQKAAELYCEEYLEKQEKLNKKDIPVKTYNTSLHDTYWGEPSTEMPKCKKSVGPETVILKIRD